MQAWEQRRKNLTVRLLWLMIPAKLALAAQHARVGAPLMFLPLLAIAFDLSAIAVLTVRPGQRAWVTRFLGCAYTVLMALEASTWPAGSQAPLLELAPFLGLAGFLFDGPGLGLSLLAGTLVSLAVAWLRLDPAAVSAKLALGQLATAALLGTISAWAWNGSLQRAHRQYLDWAASLQQQWEERGALTTALFQEQLRSLARLRETLHLPDAVAWRAAHEELGRLEGIQQSARLSRQALADSPLKPVEEVDFVMEGFRVNLLLGLSATVLFLGANLLTGLLDLSVLLPVGGAMLLLALVQPRGRAPWPWALRVMVWGGPVAIVAGLCRGLGGSLSFWPLAILNAATLLSRRAALAMTALGAAVLLGAPWAAASPLGSWALQAPLLLGVWIATLVACDLALEQRAVLLRGLSRRGRDLALALGVRRRLLGTLHHDVASLQTALQGVVNLGRAGMADPGDWARVRRLLERLGELLGHGEELLLGDQPVAAGALGPVSVAEAGAAMHELYADRLLDRRITLVSDLPLDLRVRAVASLLRDSILSNLVSNAIKASRPGATVELQASIGDGQVALHVLDRGPGVPDEVLRRLDLGLEQGSHGDGGGQGLGLLLVREQLARLGGSLELVPRSGGGTVATVRLPEA